MQCCAETLRWGTALGRCAVPEALVMLRCAAALYCCAGLLHCGAALRRCAVAALLRWCCYGMALRLGAVLGCFSGPLH